MRNVERGERASDGGLQVPEFFAWVGSRQLHAQRTWVAVVMLAHNNAVMRHTCADACVCHCPIVCSYYHTLNISQSMKEFHPTLETLKGSKNQEPML
jgi:hypothetical protein